MHYSDDITRLTPRESEIVALVLSGLPDWEIARQLQITIQHVKNTLHHARQKGAVVPERARGGAHRISGIETLKAILGGRTKREMLAQVRSFFPRALYRDADEEEWAKKVIERYEGKSQSAGAT